MDQLSRMPAVAPSPWDRPRVLVPAFALIALAGAAFPAFSTGANVLVVAAGGTLFWLGLSARIPRRESPRRLSAHAGWWLLPLLTLGVIEIVNLALGSTHDHPTLSTLTDPLLRGYPARVAVYFGWLMGYWGLVRR
jgi:hypothetical protein